MNFLVLGTELTFGDDNFCIATCRKICIMNNIYGDV